MCQSDLHPNKHTENDPVTRSLKHFPSMTVVYKIPDDIIRLWWNTADCFVCRFLTDGRRPIRSFSPKHASPSVSRSGSDWLERLLSHLKISSASGETAESHTHTHTHTHTHGAQVSQLLRHFVLLWEQTAARTVFPRSHKNRIDSWRWRSCFQSCRLFTVRTVKTVSLSIHLLVAKTS